MNTDEKRLLLRVVIAVSAAASFLLLAACAGAVVGYQKARDEMATAEPVRISSLPLHNIQANFKRIADSPFWLSHPTPNQIDDILAAIQRLSRREMLIVTVEASIESPVPDGTASAFGGFTNADHLTILYSPALKNPNDAMRALAGELAKAENAIGKSP